MASAGDEKDGGGGEDRAPRECMACRGSGSVVSNLGGTPKTVTCPWCRGTGTRIADVDAQSGWPESGGDASGAGAAASPGDKDSAGDAAEGTDTGGGDPGGAAA